LVASEEDWVSGGSIGSQMSAKELNRLEILGRVLERRLTQAQAA
jgi:hypothetical protein